MIIQHLIPYIKIGENHAIRIILVNLYLPAMWETWVQSQGWEDPLAKGKATPSSILAWRIPQTLQSMRLQELDTTEQLSLTSLQ